MRACPDGGGTHICAVLCLGGRAGRWVARGKWSSCVVGGRAGERAAACQDRRGACRQAGRAGVAGTPGRPRPHRQTPEPCRCPPSAPPLAPPDLFQREARTLAGLDHPSIPRYLDYFEEDTAGPGGDKAFFLVQVRLCVCVGGWGRGRGWWWWEGGSEVRVGEVGEATHHGGAGDQAQAIRRRRSAATHHSVPQAIRRSASQCAVHGNSQAGLG